MRHRSPKALAVLAVAPFAATACTTTGGPPDGDKIVLSVEKTEIAGGCDVEVFETYPSDLSTQARDLRVSDAASPLSSGATMGGATLPRPADDPRPVDNGDGTTTFRVFQRGYSPCRPVPLEIEIGACRVGQCLPMRVSDASLPEGVTVRGIR
ncbi:hypothetical protein [Amorphus sp. 3PC139-8]|uniref:hypothetical protein n=1 Tax=Amorphus sp. 3PC139-8 TaxID=2735676 RepID=UPI00345CBA82